MTDLQKYITSDKMRQYISSLRNSDKKDYALRYAIWLLRSKEDVTVPAPQSFHLSYMAAQAVRSQLQLMVPSCEELSAAPITSSQVR